MTSVSHIPIVDSDLCIVCVSELDYSKNLCGRAEFFGFFPAAVHWVVFPWHGIGPTHA